MATILHHQEIISEITQKDPSPSFFKDIFFKRENTRSTNIFKVRKYSNEQTPSTLLANEDMDPTLITRSPYDEITVEPAVIIEDFNVKNSELREVLMGGHQYDGKQGQETLKEIIEREMKEKFERQSRAEEKMCAQAIVEGKVTTGKATYDFTRNAANTIALSTSEKWSSTTADIGKKITEFISIASRSGATPTELVMGTDAALAFINNASIDKKLYSDKNNFINTEKIEYYGAMGAAYLGYWAEKSLHLWQYNKNYIDNNGNRVQFLDTNKVVLGSRNADCSIEYGSIVADGAVRKTKYWSRLYQTEIGSKPFKLFYTSSPLAVPTQSDAFVTFEAI